jgi:PAS domain S-box-containing protein
MSERALKILIVEDEGLIARDVADSLREMGYSVAGIAPSGERAMEIIEAEHPDAVLMDIVIQGGMDGIETASLIRERYGTPVIYLTAYADDSLLGRMRSSAPFGYLIKPFSAPELHFTIETAVYKHRLDQELKQSKEQYQALVETSGAVPWELDVVSRAFTYMGHQIQKVIVTDAPEIKDLDAFMALVHPDDAGAVREFFQGGLPAEGEHSELEFRMIGPGNATRWLRDSVTLARGRDGLMVLRGFLMDVTRRKEAEIERERSIAELREALDKIQHLHGLLPICAWCKKIRDDQGYWKQVEVYIEEHSGAEFTHSMCPECQKKMEEELGRG